VFRSEWLIWKIHCFYSANESNFTCGYLISFVICLGCFISKGNGGFVVIFVERIGGDKCPLTKFVGVCNLMWVNL